MPAILTHKAITILARDRLAHLHQITARMLERKRITGERISAFELKLNAVARDAANIMSAPPLADRGATPEGQTLSRSAPGLLQGVSKFAVMGAMGPDLPAFGHFFQPGQGWAFDTIHKGTPDYNRDAVVARTTDMALAMHRLGEAKIVAQFRDSDISVQELAQTRERNKLRAYVMGHLCHVAGDVISHPFVNDLEWHPAIPGQDHAGHGASEAMIDAAVARDFFRRPRTRGGQNWSDWWPGEDDIAPYFFESYAEAFAEVYGPGRRPGFADFEAEQDKLDPPPFTPEFMRHGYKTYRGFALNFAYGFGYGEWFGMLTPLLAPALFAPLIGQALPHGRTFFSDPDTPASERAHFELLTLPLASGGLTSLIMGGMMLPFASKGAADRSILGLVTQSYTLAAWLGSVIEASQVDDPEDGISDGVRWAFGFALPMFMSIPFGGETISDSVTDFDHPRPYVEKPYERRALVTMVNLMPLIAFVLMILLLIPFWIIRGKGTDPDRLKLNSAGFWATTGVWMALMLAAWILLPFALRKYRMPEHADSSDDALQRHGVRLFDDQTLFDDPLGSGLYYPSDLRPMARLWWTGDGTMQIRSDRFGLTFRPEGGAAQTVPGPMIPMTMADYLQMLRETVVDAGGDPGGLQGAVFAEDPRAAYLLPAGAVFAAHGDFEEGASEAEITAGAATFRDLGDADGAEAYHLYHAPKPWQAVHMGRDGTFGPGAQDAIRAAGQDRGYRYVVDSVQEDPRTSEALMTQAADLGALLCMGAAPHMAETPAAGDKVYQVFRNWSLDRRRVNEWRMLVSGGARSDKADGPDRYDPAMPQGPDGADPAGWRAPLSAAADPNALAEGESTARGYGWIPTLREFVRLVEEGEDILGTDTDPMRPDVPVPRAVTRAMAYLVDAPDPVEV